MIRGEIDDYLDHPPRPTDVSCMIEVADSSLSLDSGLEITARVAAY
jgi:hypothetical protein